MINLLLPPLYQQHFFAQPQPQLYHPITAPTQNTTNLQSINVTKPESNSEFSNQMQNESPLIAAQTEDPPNSVEESTFTTGYITEPTTEKQLEFRPVQKKMSERSKSFQK